MSVNAVLDKLKEHNAGVIGCLATHGAESYHNLSAPYELVDAQTVSEEASQVFELMDSLEDPTAEFEEFFLEMKSHSVFAHRLDDGVLVVLNKRVDRAVFRRLKVGVNLFIKPLKRELVKPPEPVAPPPVEPAPAPQAQAQTQAEPVTEDDGAGRRKKKRFYRGIEY